MNDSGTEPIPTRRTAGLVVRTEGHETLVLDTLTDTVHCLPADIARVWAECGPGRTYADAAAATGLDRATIDTSVDQLLERDLVETAGIDRRWFLRRSALVGAGAIAAPLLIESVVAPPAFAAGSHVQGTVTQISCSGGASGKINYQVTVTLGAPTTQYFPTITYTNGGTITDVANTVTTSAGGTGSSTGQTSTHTPAVSVTLRLYTDAAHTQLVFTSSPIPLPGC